MRAASILLVEDSAAEARLVKTALSGSPREVRLIRVADGDEALRYLYRQASYATAERPDLILLDLNLPKRGGREVLALIKADEELRAIPVVVLTTSAAPEDIEGSYDLGASGYLTKPPDFDELVLALENVQQTYLL